MSPMLALLYRQINVFRPNPNTYSVDFAVQKCTLTPHNTSCRFITSTNKSEHVWQNSQQNSQKCFPHGKQRWHLLRRIRFFLCLWNQSFSRIWLWPFKFALHSNPRCEFLLSANSCQMNVQVIHFLTVWRQKMLHLNKRTRTIYKENKNLFCLF